MRFIARELRKACGVASLLGCQSSLVFTLIALGLAISTRPIEGQTISFFRQFSTPGIDGATAVAADASGIYVIGNRRAFAGVRKYDSRGNELWTREISVPGQGPGQGPQLVRAAADATGVYVSGEFADQSVRKYDAGGDELWTRQLGFRPTGGVAVDATGVYVAGVVFSPSAEGFLRKYNAEGAELWTSRFRDPGIPLAVAVDATGVYVFGSSVRKWDPRGTELWSRQLGTSTGQLLLVGAADPTGFFVVGGISDRYFLGKYDAGGNELWTRPIATSDSALYPKGVAADATGVYVVGTTSFAGPALPGQCRSGSGNDSFVRKYDPDGTEVWTRQFGTLYSTGSSGVAVDASGVYVVGETGAPEARASAFLAKFEKSPAVITPSRPRILPDCVVNAASYVGGGVAPGEIVTLFGSAMGPTELATLRLTEDRRLATTVADTRLLFNGVPAPLVYVSDKQGSAIVPYAVAGRTSVDVQVEYKGVQSDPVTVPVLASRPGIFSQDGSGRGQGAILNEDGSLNSPSNPAQRGSIISIFATGGGEAAAGVVDGQIVSGVLPRASLPVSVVFDVGPSADALDEPPKQGEVLYAGGVSGSVAGLLQVNVRVPANAVDTGNAVPFALIIGSHSAVLQVTIALH